MNILSAPPVQTGCGACKDGAHELFPFTMAFQPIVNVDTWRVFAYEALVRGLNNEGAYSILDQVTVENRYAFDQSCRVKAITLAARLGVHAQGAKLSVNFMPGAVYSPAACIQLTLKTATACGFPLDHLIFEMTEGEMVRDPRHLALIIDEYRKHGFQTALDDFGSGYCGLNLFSDVSTDLIKLDMHLIRDLDKKPVSQAIVRALVEMCTSLNKDVIAEGVETMDEFHAVQDCGIRLMQGYLLAKPRFEGLPEILIPASGPLNSTTGDSAAFQWAT